MLLVVFPEFHPSKIKMVRNFFGISAFTKKWKKLQGTRRDREQQRTRNKKEQETRSKEPGRRNREQGTVATVAAPAAV